MQQQEQQLGVMELVKNQMPTLKALIALNIGEGPNVETLALQELEYLKMQAALKPDLLNCRADSVLLAVKSVLKKNLSLDPTAGLVYVQTRSVNTAKKGEQAKWEKVVEISETANGLISINRQCGTILDWERPKVIKNAAGKVIAVKFRYLVPSVPAPRWEEVEFDESDFERWKIKSHEQNARGWNSNSGKPQPDINTLNYANPNYTNFNGGLDPEFARAKAVRHGLKKRGTNLNEGRAKVIVMDRKDVQVVPGESAIKEAGDENIHGNGENEFTEYQEVNTSLQQDQYSSGPSADDL